MAPYGIATVAQPTRVGPRGWRGLEAVNPSRQAAPCSNRLSRRSAALLSVAMPGTSTCAMAPRWHHAMRRAIADRERRIGCPHDGLRPGAGAGTNPSCGAWRLPTSAGESVRGGERFGRSASGRPDAFVLGHLLRLNPVGTGGCVEMHAEQAGQRRRRRTWRLIAQPCGQAASVKTAAVERTERDRCKLR